MRISVSLCGLGIDSKGNLSNIIYEDIKTVTTKQNNEY